MKDLEIELTFLASKIPPEIKNVQPTKLSDIYIPEASEFPVLRVRRQGDRCEITKKIPIRQGDFSSHVEHTIALTDDEFEALTKTSNRIIEKDRYTVQIQSYRAEVDIFHGELEGLVAIDFEFKSEQEKSKFLPPDCCLADVTQEKFILGGQLAGLSYADIKKDLDRYNYRKLEL